AASLPLLVREGRGRGPARLDVSRARGFSRFVGRQEEMATLEAALTRTLAGQGQVVGVVAAAGGGKSRLCTGFAGHCRARGIQVAEAHCPTIGKSVPFLPPLGLLPDLFGLRGDGRPPRAARP